MTKQLMEMLAVTTIITPVLALEMINVRIALLLRVRFVFR